MLTKLFAKKKNTSKSRENFSPFGFIIFASTSNMGITYHFIVFLKCIPSKVLFITER